MLFKILLKTIYLNYKTGLTFMMCLSDSPAQTFILYICYFSSTLIFKKFEVIRHNIRQKVLKQICQKLKGKPFRQIVEAKCLMHV